MRSCVRCSLCCWYCCRWRSRCSAESSRH
jgi:hypothetical protein